VVLHGLRNRSGADGDSVFAYGGAAAAALCSAFVFTVWQNSNEAEVYMVSAFSIALCCWLAWLWRGYRGQTRAAHMLLLMVYVAAFSIGNHLLTLLVGPALIGYMWYVMRTQPLDDPRERSIEWAQWAVVAAIWATLIGTGLGSTALLALAGLGFVAAAVYSASTGSVRFPVVVLIVSAVGVSTYLFLYIRAGLDPFINEADPSTWESLLAVIRREQYPPRSPIDNPLFPSGPGNPGRSLTIIQLQILNYLQYFDWQWANGFAPTQSVFHGSRLPFTLAFTSLGIYGLKVLRDRDRPVYWLLLLIFLITGPGLVAYMNFRPGFSLGYDRFPDIGQHEVRERDYFFLISFQMWGLFAGVGVAGAYRWVRNLLAQRGSSARIASRMALPVFVLALLPFLLNFKAASRAHGPETALARDFSYNLLQTIEPYGIVFTNGDNDTFPLWYLQEVEGVRQDVSVVNLSLGNTDWYIRQLRDNPVRPFDPDEAPWFANDAPENPPPPLHTWTDADVASLMPQVLQNDLRFAPNNTRIDHVLPGGSPLYVKDLLILRLIAENAGRRPIYFSTTAGASNWLNLDDYLVQEALAVRLYPNDPPPLSRLSQGVMGIPVDLPRTDSLVWGVYRYAGLLEADTLDLDPTNRNIASNLSLPFLTLYRAYEALGDRESAIRNLRRVYQLTPQPEVRQLLDQIESMPDIFGDSPTTSIEVPIGSTIVPAGTAGTGGR
jgi:hypothetical protein